MLYGSIILLLTALLARTANGLYSKYALTKVDSFSLFFFVNLLVVIAVFPFVYKEIPSFFALPAVLIIALIGSGLLQGLSGIVGNYALHNVPVSVHTILNQLQIIWIVIAGIVFLSEKISAQSALGIALIIVSAFIVSGNIHIRKEVGMRPILLVIGSSILAAIAVIFDKILVTTFDQLFYFFLMLLVPLIFLIPDFTKRNKFYIDQMKSHWLIYFITAGIFAVNYYSLLSLYSLPDVPLSVAYPIRSMGAIFAVAIAIPLFGETKNIKRKLLATMLAVAGAVIVKLA